MSFTKIRDVKSSKKVRVCEDCGHAIQIGEPYRYYAGMFDGEFYAGEAHADCQIWASQVMCCDEGRGSLKNGDPAEPQPPLRRPWALRATLSRERFSASGETVGNQSIPLRGARCTTPCGIMPFVRRASLCAE